MKLVIEPGRSALNYWRDFWLFRELLYILAWRDIAVRYKQTIIGVGWAVVRPAVIVAGLLFFRRMAGAQAEGVPDVLLVFGGALPWQLFSTALTDCSSSVIGNANLISKVYFPRIIVPIAAILTSSADFFVSLLFLVGLMAFYGYLPTWRFLLLPFVFTLIFSLSLGLGLFFAALNVKFRDFRFIVPFIVQFGMFVSPVGFGGADVPKEWRVLYAINPLVGAIDGFRWTMYGDAFPVDWSAVLLSLTGALTALYFGVSYFRRVENSFADII